MWAYEPSGEASEASATAAATSQSLPPTRRAIPPAAAAARPTASHGTSRKSAWERPGPHASTRGAAHAAGTWSRLVAMPKRETASRRGARS
jgi:hypothetical protein